MPMLYALLSYLALPLAAIHLLWRARRQPAYLGHWRERFAWAFAPRHGEQGQTPLIWLHAVSVGEIRAAEPLVTALLARYSDHVILLTGMTPTGRATAEALFSGNARVEYCYLPYDTPWGMRRFLAHYRPTLGLVMETEWWPNLIAACGVRRIPVLLINARLSARSAHRYQKIATLARSALRGFAAITAGSEKDAQRLRTLGADAVTVCGNLKFDCLPPPAQLLRGAQLRDLARTPAGPRPIILCASTREGEEALLLDAWCAQEHTGNMAEEATDAAAALLVIVPRHPQRFDAVAELIAARGLSYQRYSTAAPVAPTCRVWLGDSMGELFAWYAACDVAIIGGSLGDTGSQNLIEACAVGAPVLIGPSTYNFAAAASAAQACGAACAVRDAAAAIQQAHALLRDPVRRAAMGAAGKQWAQMHGGATARNLAVIAPYLS